MTAVDVEMTAQVRTTNSAEMGKTPVEGVKNIIAVGAGKGGVGKTTVAVNLAIALSQCGGRVAMIDGDIYGPNVPIMLGIQHPARRPTARRSSPPSSTGFSWSRWRS